MPVARKRHTNARRDRARVFLKLKAKNLVECPNCKTPVKPHTVCSNCGQYKGKEAVDTTKKLAKKAKKK